MALNRHVQVLVTILVLVLPYDTLVVQGSSLTEFLFPRNGASPLFRAFVERFAPHVPQNIMGGMGSLCQGNSSTLQESFFPELFADTPLHLINTATGVWYPLTHHLSNLIPNASDPSNTLLGLFEDFGGAFGGIMDADVGYFPCLDNESFIEINLIATAFPDPPSCDPLGTGILVKRSVRSHGLADLTRNIVKRQDKGKKDPTVTTTPTLSTTTTHPPSTDQADTCDITKESIEDIFDDIDTDDDGFLTEEELIAAVESDGITITDAVREQLRREIKILDKNNDGKLSLQEMKDALKKKKMPCGSADLIAGMARKFLPTSEDYVSCERTAGQLQSFYGSFDDDQDGTLSYSEMLQIFTDHGVTLDGDQLSTLRTEIEVGDTNNDGTISVDELIEMLRHATMISSCHLSTIAMMVALVPLNVQDVTTTTTTTTITTTTIPNVPVNIISSAISQDDINCLFDTYDRNGDGRLSLEELLVALHTSGVDVTSDFIIQVQNEILIIDIDRDGELTQEELLKIIQDIAQQCSESTDITSPTPTGPTVLVCNLNGDQIEDLFDGYDTNNDGKLSEQELIDALENRGVDVTEAVREQIRREIELVDTNGDGEISLEELTAALRMYSQLCDQTTQDPIVGHTTPTSPSMFCGVGGDQIEDLFDEYDTNNDGKLSEQELIAALENRGVDVTEAVREQIRREIELVDTNGDGEISLEELKAALRKYAQLCTSSSTTVSPSCAIAESRLEQLFNSYDVSPKDAYLTMAELLEALSRQNIIINNEVVGEVEREIQLIDTTGDNQITLDELKAAFDQYSQLCQGRIIGTVPPEVTTTTLSSVVTICGLAEDELERLFQSYDTNNDGTLTMDELIPPLAARGVVITPLILQQLNAEIQLIDTDNDNSISLSELRSALILHPELCDGKIITPSATRVDTQTTTPTTTTTTTVLPTTPCDPYPVEWRTLISDWFDYYDANSDNVLNLSELTRLIEDDGVIVDSDVLVLLESELQWMDPDRDGVTFDELVAALTTYHAKQKGNADDTSKCFKAVDTDGDGKWSEAEILAFWQRIGVTITDAVKRNVKQHIKDADKDGDGKISEQEYRNAIANEKKKKEDAIKKRFKEIDTDGDGKWSEAEMLAYWKKLGVPINPALRKMVQDQIKAGDKNGDGKISEQEFRDALEKERKKNEEDALKKRFKEVDKNGDGKWSEEEIIEALKKAGIAITEDVKKKVKKDIKDADKDGDGKISEQELKDLIAKEKKKNEDAKKRFKELDKNGDGKLDKNEILDGLKKKGVKITDDVRKAVEREIEQLDTDKDGKLSEEEVLKGLKEASEKTEDDIKKRFKEMDTNKDGKIDENELTNRGITEIREQARKEIRAVDTDNDGKISEQELRAALSKEKEKKKDAVTKGFEELDSEDTDSDEAESENSITEEEIIEGLKKKGVEITDEVRAKVKKLFNKMDVNPKDGKVTETEFREHKEREKKKKKDAESKYSQQYDTNDDCSLSADELEAAITDICAAGRSADCTKLQDILDNINSPIDHALGMTVGETERLFRQYDLDSDGRLTLSELVTAWSSKGLPVNIPAIQHLGRETIMADQNGDRKLCLMEVVDYLERQLTWLSPFRICPHFEIYDTVVDNELSEEEIMQALLNNGKTLTHDLEDHVSYQILLFDSDKDGMMSRYELMAAVQWDRETGVLAQYQRFDVNNTGGISEEDIMHTLGESSIVVPASDRVKIREEFATVDMDANGEISLEEFVNTLNRDEEGDIEEKFNETDANNDGELSALELVLALIAEGKVITAELIRQLQREIDQIDTDGNKCISLAELKAALSSAWTATLSLSCYVVIFFTVVYTTIW